MERRGRRRGGEEDTECEFSVLSLILGMVCTNIDDI
jgi:hypothetical protein